MKVQEMKIIHEHAAGIDVMGSEQYQELIKLKRINSIRKMMKNSNILASELSMS